MKNELVKILVSTTSEGADLVSMALFEVGSVGNVILDESQLTMSEQRLLGESGTCCVVGAVSGNAESIKKELESRLAFLSASSQFQMGELKVVVSTAVEPDWTRVWMRFYPPVRIGKIKVFPDFRKPKFLFGAIPVTIKVSDAFGTGQHPTTKACLLELQKLELAGRRVIDVGTGTGILAIAAKKLGAKNVLATDYFDVAIQETKQNAKQNGVELDIKKADLLVGVGQKADVVLANLSTELLIRLAKESSKNVANGGVLIASGVMEEGLSSVLDAFAEEGLVVRRQREDSGWYTLVFQKQTKGKE